LLEILNNIEGNRASPGTTDLGKVLSEALHAIRRRSLVFVVSDFISAPNWEKPLSLLSVRNDVIAIRLTDPLEAHLPDLGFITFQDAESGEQLFVDTHDKGFRARFAAHAQEKQKSLRSTFEKAGVDVVELSTDDDVLDAIIGFATMRKQSLRRSA
jgi:uncharacterized protein (DUF58 family)